MRQRIEPRPDAWQQNECPKGLTEPKFEVPKQRLGIADIKSDSQRYATALNDLHIEIMMIRDLNANAAWSGAQTKTTSWDRHKEQMKKEGIYDEVKFTLERAQSIKDPESFREFAEEIRARIEKGDKVASYFAMGVFWPNLENRNPLCSSDV